MFSFLNPYFLIGGAIVIAAVGGTIFYQGTQIHHYHKLYDAEVGVAGGYKQQVIDMTSAQDTQKSTTETNVTKVVTVPGATQTIIKEIHDAPEPANCGTPVLSDTDRNSF